MDSLQPSEGKRRQGDPVPERGRIGPYRLEGEIGVGGMADVYRAIDERLGRAVAVKCLQAPYARDRFRREARAIARLSHPAIVQVFDVIEDDAHGWIVMELVEGRQLSSLIADGPLDLETALPILGDLAEALVEAHGKGVLHRDLKTENVMVTPAGRAKLLDFGLARWLEYGQDQDQNQNLTMAGQIIGTPHAMSPEQAMSLDLDHRSDLFSLGTLFYEALTGARPFHGPGIIGTLKMVCVEPHRPCHELSPGVPRQLSRLIDRMLEKEPERRPRTAGVVARAIRRLVRPESAEPELGATLSCSPLARPAVPPAPRAGRSEPRPAPSVERRTITIVHCELASSGSRSVALEPEELLEVRPELERIAARAAARFEGEVGEHLDQGLRLFFGHPRVHEDDARRAVYAAREIVAGVEGLAVAAGEKLVAEAGLGLGMRVGIHTGPVVVAGGIDRRASGGAHAFGETGNLAAVLQGLALPGEILLSDVTHGIVSSFFDAEARPTVQVPGFSEPVASYLWLGESVPGKRPG